MISQEPPWHFISNENSQAFQKDFKSTHNLHMDSHSCYPRPCDHNRHANFLKDFLLRGCACWSTIIINFNQFKFQPRILLKAVKTGMNWKHWRFQTGQSVYVSVLMHWHPLANHTRWHFTTVHALYTDVKLHDSYGQPQKRQPAYHHIWVNF